MSKTALRLSGIEVTRGKSLALQDIDLQVEAGQVHLLLGASGAGKTTLLRIVAGFELPERGRVEIGGRAVSDGSRLEVPPAERGVGMVFQDGALWSHLSVEGHLRFGLRRRVSERAARDAQVEELLRRVGLWDRRKERPGTLSGGERQRLGIARALALRPKLLLLDEPLAHVDLPAQRALLAWLLEVIRSGDITALWVTHRPEEAGLVGERASLLSEGRLCTMSADEALRRAGLGRTSS